MTEHVGFDCGQHAELGDESVIIEGLLAIKATRECVGVQLALEQACGL